MKRMQKMNAAEMMILTYKLNIINTLRTRKKLIVVQKFKKVMIFRMIFEKSRKILISNEF